MISLIPKILGKGGTVLIIVAEGSEGPVSNSESDSDVLGKMILALVPGLSHVLDWYIFIQGGKSLMLR